MEGKKDGADMERFEGFQFARLLNECEARVMHDMYHLAVLIRM